MTCLLTKKRILPTQPYHHHHPCSFLGSLPFSNTEQGAERGERGKQQVDFVIIVKMIVSECDSLLPLQNCIVECSKWWCYSYHCCYYYYLLCTRRQGKITSLSKLLLLPVPLSVLLTLLHQNSTSFYSDDNEMTLQCNSFFAILYMQ